MSPIEDSMSHMLHSRHDFVMRCTVCLQHTLFIVYSNLSCVTCCVSGVTLIVTKLFVTLAALFCVTQ